MFLGRHAGRRKFRMKSEVDYLLLAGLTVLSFWTTETYAQRQLAIVRSDPAPSARNSIFAVRT